MAGPFEPLPAMNEAPTLALADREVSLFQCLAHLQQPCLILYSGAAAGQRFDLDEGLSLIGRSPSAAVRVEAIGISRRHAELRVASDGVELRDLGSANFTYVNDVQVNGSVRLADGDLVRVANVVMRFHDRRSIDALLHDRIYRLATIDIGTEVYNRRYLQEAARLALVRARRDGLPLALVCLDLDDFKSVNDRWGHPAGDRVLKESAAVVSAALRPTDVLGRWGGEEFAVLLKDTDATAAAKVAERLRDAMASHVFVIEPAGPRPAVHHRQTISLGVAEVEPSMTDEFDLLAAADRMLYAAKRAGRNRVVVAGRD